MSSEVNEYFLECVSISELLGFDEHLRELFEDTFYSVAVGQNDSTDGNNDSINVNQKRSLNDIIQYFLKNWKNMKDYSGITKSLATIITGSVVEGSPLARLSHPDMKDTIEIEADVMYIVGCIPKDAAENSFKELSDSPGFLWIKYTPDLELFTEDPLPSIEDLVETSDDGEKYINGNKLKLMYKDLQPNKKQLYRTLEIHDTPYEVSINQNISGPSSEIIFKRKCIIKREELKQLSLFLMTVKSYLHKIIDDYGQRMRQLRDMEQILISTSSAITDIKINQISGNSNKYVEDIKEMVLQLSDAVHEHVKGCKKLSKERSDILQFCNSLNKMLNFSYDILEFKIDAFSGSDQVFPFSGSDQLFSEIDELLNSSDNTVAEGKNTSSRDVEILGAIINSFSITEGIQNERENLHKFSDAISKCLLSKSDMNYLNKSCTAILKETIVSFDNVSSIYCKFWPNLASEWCTRQRLYPSHDMIKRIAQKGCHVVPKAREISSNDLDWRWSFSSAEILLAQTRTSTMKYCYFIFKSLFYKYLKFKLNNKSLPSYVAKTCMLYVSESHSENWWGTMDDLSKVANCVQELFKFLHKGLSSSVLPHYFIPRINLLANIPEEVLKKALKKTHLILESPETYMSFDPSVIQSLRNFCTDALRTKPEKLSNHEDEDHISKGLQRIDKILRLNNELLMIYLKTFRNEQQWNYKQFRDKILLYERYIEKQEKCLSQAQSQGSFTNAHLAIEETLVQNKKDVIQCKIQCDNARRLALYGLKRVTSLCKLYCKVCDVCMEKIPCGSGHYECSTGCDYDVCIDCYKAKIKKEEIFNAPILRVHQNADVNHSHPLNHTTKCSVRCYSQIDEDNLNKKECLESSESFLSALKSSQREACNIAFHFGFNDGKDCELIEDIGYIMEKLLQNFYNNKVNNDANTIEMTKDVAGEYTTQTKNLNPSAKMQHKNEEKTAEEQIEDSIQTIAHIWKKIKKMELMKKFIFL